MTTAEFTGQVAVVTGAASGIGRGIAFRALQENMQLVATDISGEALEGLVAEAQERGFELETATLDVADGAAMQQFAEHVFDKYGRVNLLFNNAGILTLGRSWELPISDWQRSIDVNVMGVVNGIRCFVPPMMKQGSPARVLNTSSLGGLLSGGQYMGAYQGSKHMVAALTESLDRELRSQGASVAVSLICPGAVSTAIGAATEPAVDHSESWDAPVEPEELAYREQFSDLVAKGESAEDLAREIFDGIRENQFWIIPKSVDRSRLKKRSEDIVTAK